MKKHISVSAAALFAAFALANPLFAADVVGGASGSANGAVSGDNGMNGGTAGGVNGAVSGDKGMNGGAAGGANGAVSGNKGAVNGQAGGNSDMRRANASASGGTTLKSSEMRSEFRGYSRRLTDVDKRVNEAERAGHYTAEQARQRREEIAKIRNRFKAKADRTARNMTIGERAKMEADVKANEDAMAEVGK